jgi:hypothetical protein
LRLVSDGGGQSIEHDPRVAAELMLFPPTTRWRIGLDRDAGGDRPALAVGAEIDLLELEPVGLPGALVTVLADRDRSFTDLELDVGRGAQA